MFTDRNMYFDKMRFMVFDVLPETHQNFRTDFIRFLATILILASNPVPGSAMQPRRLYCLDTKTDDTPLCTLITSYDKKLAATAEIIDNEMEKIRSEGGRVTVCADGREEEFLNDGEIVTVTRAKRRLKLCFLGEKSNLEVFFRKF